MKARPIVLTSVAVGMVSLLAAALASTRGPRQSVPTLSASDKPQSLVGTGGTPEPSPVDSLNDAILKRFQDVDENQFGMSRMPWTTPGHVKEFAPETPQEKAAVADLRRQGWTVAVYLGGRRLSRTPLSRSEWESGNRYGMRRTLSEPLPITSAHEAENWPKPWELQEIGRKALTASMSKNHFDTSFGRWSVDARPVRATRQLCLDCHGSEIGSAFPNPPKSEPGELAIGDALGVLIYVYTRTGD